MDLYAGDILAATTLVLSATLVLLASVAYARARAARLLVPAGAGLAVLALSGFLTVRGIFSSEPPGELDLPLSAAALVVVIILYLVWFAARRNRGVVPKDAMVTDGEQ